MAKFSFKTPFEIFKNVLAELSPPDIGKLVPGDAVRIPNDSREIPTIQYPYGIVPITNSSAGIGRIITLAYLIVWAWNEHKENCKLRGLHPDSRIVVRLMNWKHICTPSGKGLFSLL